MLSLSRNPTAACLTAGAAFAALSAAAGAAEFYYQPIVQLSTQYNTNLDLANGTAQKRGAEGYYVDAATNLGFATPTSETLLQPRLLYNYYPSASDRNRLEAFLNGATRMSWQRDRFNLTGSFDHRDDVNAEQPGAPDNNTVNPGTGTVSPSTGVTAVGVTRDYLVLDPTYTHLVTPLSGLGVSGEYQRMSFSREDGGHIGFDFYQAKLFYSKTIDLRTDFQIGVLGNHMETPFINAHTDSGGLVGSGGYNWTQTLRSTLTAQVQETRFREHRVDNDPVSVNSHPWGVVFDTVYSGQLDKYTFSLGRSLYPSSAGGIYQTDQVRGQYDRDLTQRLHVQGSVRIFRYQNVSGVVNDDYRNYGTGNIRVQYMLTQRLFVATAYTYVYQKYRLDPDSADASVFNLTFGYKGLERQQR